MIEHLTGIKQGTAFEVQNEELDGDIGVGTYAGFEDVGMDGLALRRGAGINEALKKRSNGGRRTEGVRRVVSSRDERYCSTYYIYGV